MSAVATAPPKRGLHAPATAWRIDSANSSAEFAVSKRLFSVKSLIVTGRVGPIRGTIALDEHVPANSAVTLAIDLDRIDTGNARRDEHLRAADYFDVLQFPLARFVSRAITPIGVTTWRYRVDGDLTIRGVSRPVSLDVEYTPARANSREPLARFVATTTLNRRDFGIGRDRPFVRVADDVQIVVTIAATPASR